MRGGRQWPHQPLDKVRSKVLGAERSWGRCVHLGGGLFRRVGESRGHCVHAGGRVFRKERVRGFAPLRLFFYSSSFDVRTKHLLIEVGKYWKILGTRWELGGNTVRTRWEIGKNGKKILPAPKT